MVVEYKQRIIITGGAGFIGSNLLLYLVPKYSDTLFINIDCLTYAGNLSNLKAIESADNYVFERINICDYTALEDCFNRHQPTGLIHLAAESHVDRSITGPTAFIETNIIGTFNLLELSRRIMEKRRADVPFRFHHVSTDEVYGSLGPAGYFREESPYDPSSPYSASKAASDHFVKAYFRTYGLPTLITNCSNNYGPYQFPEKLIPLMILNIIEEKPLPVYGDGKNVRDWLYVIDHCDAIFSVLEKGLPGETYNIGGGAERENIRIVHMLCDLMDRRLKRSGKASSRRLIQFVTDRPGHDRRYAIDATKIRKELGWVPGHRFEAALEETVDWYLAHPQWVDSVRSGEYRRWIETNYNKRQPDG